MKPGRRYLQIRRGGMLVALSLLCTLVALAEVRASVDAELLARTRAVLGIPEHWQRGAPRELVINGARVEVASGYSKESLPALLDRAEADCRVHSAGLHRRLHQVKVAIGRASSPWADGILRADNGREGLVACLALGQHEASWAELSTRLEAFSRDGDLAALGGVRMLRAQARPRGAFFVTIATRGRVPLLEMFPPESDAPGLELEALPRPPQSRRVLSVWQQNGSPALNAYESGTRDGRVLTHYLENAASRGFRVLEQRTAGEGRPRSVLLAREGHQIVITEQSTRRGTLIVVLVLDVIRSEFRGQSTR